MTLRNLILTDAVESYENAIQIEPHSSLAWLKKAIAYFEMGNYIEALDSVNRSIEIDPANADALYVNYPALKDGACDYDDVVSHLAG